MIKKIAACVCMLAGLSACAPQTRFEWGNYEPALYAFYKDTAARSAYETALTQAIAAGKKSGKVAPGLCAELGYMQLEDGNTLAAKASFDEEMTLFPESRVFLVGIIERMNGGQQSKKEPTS